MDNPDNTQQRLQKAFEIFGEVVELPVGDRDSYLRDRCEGDADLQQQVVDLLAHDQHAISFLTPMLAVGELGVGQSFANRYEIREVLGEGGMAAIYKAWDGELDRLVVIKVIHPSLAGSKKVLRRFKQELLLTRQITHENVIRIFDIGNCDRIKFITMEYIDGVDLKKLLIDRGKFSAREALPMMRQICQGLHAAHEKGVIHRDLKPQNIMRESNGRIVVTDFGIAHSDAQRMTATGETIGTPEYMSPEQAKGRKIDRRSDVFSLGLVFYELLTGKLPFKGANAVETKYKRVNETALAPNAVDKTIPPQISHIVMRCLEKDPSQRYPTAAAVLLDLDALDSPLRARPDVRGVHGVKSLSLSWKAVIAVSVVIIVILVLLLLRRYFSWT